MQKLNCRAPFNVLISVFALLFLSLNGCKSYTKILKTNITNFFQRNLLKFTNVCFYFMTFSNVQITYMLLVRQFPVRGKLKFMGPSLNSLSRFFENLRKSSYKIENSGNLRNCEIFFTYYFFYVRGYKATLRGGNDLSFIKLCLHAQ